MISRNLCLCAILCIVSKNFAIAQSDVVINANTLSSTKFVGITGLPLGELFWFEGTAIGDDKIALTRVNGASVDQLILNCAQAAKVGNAGRIEGAGVEFVYSEESEPRSIKSAIHLFEDAKDRSILTQVNERLGHNKIREELRVVVSVSSVVAGEVPIFGRTGCRIGDNLTLNCLKTEPRSKYGPSLIIVSEQGKKIEFSNQQTRTLPQQNKQKFFADLSMRESKPIRCFETIHISNINNADYFVRLLNDPSEKPARIASQDSSSFTLVCEYSEPK